MKSVIINKNKSTGKKNKYKYQKIKFKRKQKYKPYSRKILLYISFLLLIILLIYVIKKIIINYKNQRREIESGKNISDNKFEYFCCFCSMGRQENKYVRELIEYYINLGVGKFVFADNDLPEEEKLSDVLQDYINNSIVDIIDVIGKPTPQVEVFGMLYDKYKTRCEWLTFFDFDEYIEMHFEDGKNLLLKEYLTNPIFKNCDSIAINWLMYTDNNLLYYDKRKLIERFTKPSYSNPANKFIKSIIRGNLTGPAFQPHTSNHSPKGVENKCDSMGQPVKINDILTPPRFKYAYLKHYNTKTAEEYAYKILRGNILFEK